MEGGPMSQEKWRSLQEVFNAEPEGRKKVVRQKSATEKLGTCVTLGGGVGPGNNSQQTKNSRSGHGEKVTETKNSREG